MNLLKKPFGEYQTNCYILQTPAGAVVIDPGMGAAEWVKKTIKELGAHESNADFKADSKDPKAATNAAPIAIINTHGHFDHVWDNAALKAAYPATPLIAPEADLMMIEQDIFGLGQPVSTPDILVACNRGTEVLEVRGVKIAFHHFPGHTPGCSMVEVGGQIFSGDFIFKRSVGRSDFTYSNHADMKESLMRFREMRFEKNFTLYPGHGDLTDIESEQKNVEFWIGRM